MKTRPIFLLLITGFGALRAVDQITPLAAMSPSPESVQMVRSVEHRITSTAVGDSFRIKVRLPESYDQSPGSFPVLYVLDADCWFGLTADVADNLPAAKETPEVIVVGIAYGGTIDDWWQKRARDFLPACRRTAIPPDIPLAGGADKFQKFLATELFPFVESHYHALAGNRTLVGFSYGGVFAAHTLFTHPGLFHRYVIIAPSLGWDQEQLFETESAFHAQNAPLHATVFLAVGDKDGGAVAQERWRRFDRLVAGRNYEGLRWVSHVFPEETHLSVFPGAFTRGLKSVFTE